LKFLHANEVLISNVGPASKRIKRQSTFVLLFSASGFFFTSLKPNSTSELKRNKNALQWFYEKSFTFARAFERGSHFK